MRNTSSLAFESTKAFTTRIMGYVISIILVYDSDTPPVSTLRENWYQFSTNTHLLRTNSRQSILFYLLLNPISSAKNTNTLASAYDVCPSTVRLPSWASFAKA